MTEKPLPSPLLPWKTKIFISVLSAVTDAARRSNGTVNRRLLRFLDFREASNPKPFKGVKTADFTVDPTRNLWFRAFYPTGTADDVSLPVFIFFHGGGFAFLSPDSKAYDAVCRRIAGEIPAVVVSVNYRLSPENKYPAPYDDGFDVVKWLDGRDPAFYDFAPKADLSLLFLSGDSAGGNISHHVAQRISGAPPTEFKSVRLIGLVAIQPYFGGEERTESETRLAWAPLVSMERTDWLWKAFLPEGSDRDHEAVNPFGRNGSGNLPASFPAALVFVGGFDPLQDWQKRYCEGLKALGKEANLVVYPNAIHAFYVFPELPESELLITEVRDFIQKQSKKVAENK
ncbi:probable carboxylesterase 18 [Magnolia sinica]|uniref:probable carboxylesterase 18 n=1 Tax=Magnolia sinica TaxID=86752 RepID=UPI002658162E|nr:probable carboxylesterase 18 [Magnolia sinica]